MPIALGACLLTLAANAAMMFDEGGTGITITPTTLAFKAVAGGAVPEPQYVDVQVASSRTRLTVSASGKSGTTNWLSVAPSGVLTGNQRLRVSVAPGPLGAGTYQGTITIVSPRRTDNVAVTLTVSRPSTVTITASPTSLNFAATVGGSTPASQMLTVSAPAATAFTASVSTQNGGSAWLTISPSGSLTTNRSITVSVHPSGLAAGSYTGAITLNYPGGSVSVPVRLSIGSTGGGGGTPTNYALVGWNDLGMHCQDGKDYSIFAVLPPYNTIHAHLISKTNGLVTNNVGYSVTYEAVTDPLTQTMNTTSKLKTNFWQFAAALGFGSLAPDVGLKGYAMPGAANTPQALNFSTADNTWVAEGIPMLPYADAPAAPYPVNYFPMMRLTARDATGVVLATTNIVLPVSDEMNCNVCHASNTGTAAAKPAAGWVGNPDLGKDVKLNILRKHDDRFKGTSLYQTAATQVGYSTAGLEATVPVKPILCYNCHASNALAKNGITGIKPMTEALHGMHAQVIDPATNQTMESAVTRASCYRCHPGPQTECLRGAMGSLKTASGGNAIECQNCHGSMSTVATKGRVSWLDEPNCQSCHTGTATSNAGQIVYTSVFSSGTTVRQVTDRTFATNPNTPAAGISLYRFSSGHGGLQCEACHGSTHAEYASPVSNDNVQSVALQGHEGMLAECTTCHLTTPSTVTGGPHGLHPIGSSWVNSHESAARNPAPCQACHGVDYRGTVLSRVQANRTMANRTFAKGTIIGCYSCHNGPNGG